MVVIYAEKSSLAKAIAGTLGAGKRILLKDEPTVGHYEFKFCGEDAVLCHGVGHLMQLVSAKSYGEQFEKWDLNVFPCVPDTFRIAPKSVTVACARLVKSFLQKADWVINATDPDREGELIFSYSYLGGHMRITDEMIKQAQSVDLVDYLTSIGYTLQKAGNCYKLKLSQKFPGDLSSLSVFSDRKGWKCWSNDSSGHDAISFIQKVLGKSFQDAVCALCHGTPHITPEVAPSYSTDYGADKQLQLPDPTDGKYSRAFAYLTQTRGIDPDVVSAMMKEKKLYQDSRGNVVFVGKDEKDQPKYAAFRGTVQGKQYRGECSGSDKRFGFRMDGSCTEKVYVFESPIDAMSHASLVKQIMGKADAWKIHTRLALGGTADAALMQFLKDYPTCREVTLCLDNDEAGIKTAKLIAQKLSQQGYAVRILPPKAKDYNEQLIAYKAQVSARQSMRK